MELDQSPRQNDSRIAGAFGIALVLACAVLFPTGCRRSAENSGLNGESSDGSTSSVSVASGTIHGDASPPESAAAEPGGNDEDLSASASLSEADREFLVAFKPTVRKFCADCHVMPRPPSSTKEEWPAEVDQGFRLYAESGRKDLEVPDREQVLRYFQLQAPEQFAMPKSIENYPVAVTDLRRTEMDPGVRPPGVTHLRWADLGGDLGNRLLTCDVGEGSVRAVIPARDANDSASTTIGNVFQPVHAEAVDLDSDGWIDVVVADIGEFNADDSTLGRVVWFRRVPETDRFERRTLIDGLSRVSDVRPGDFDGDGKTDLLVAVFGWRKTGELFWLRRDGTDDQSMPTFERRDIDPRHGGVNVLPRDIDGDGDLDFAALISQGYESVEWFQNDGNGNFTPQPIWKAPDPAYGSSGMEWVDLDQDGDQDLLVTNGDSFDRGPKLHHGIQWLECVSAPGQAPEFRRHAILQMPGVLNAVPGDFDGDGDIDIVAASLLAKDVNERLMGRNTSSVVLLIRDEEGKYTPFQLEAEAHEHISIEPADFDGDGRTDFAVGTFRREAVRPMFRIRVWHANPSQKVSQR